MLIYFPAHFTGDVVYFIWKNSLAKIKAAGLSIGKHGGRIRPNQDAMCVKKNGLYVVADGVSGSADGRAASQIAVKTLIEKCTGPVPDPDVLLDAIMLANERVCAIDTVTKYYSFSATTITVVWLNKNDIRAPYIGAHLGDSFCFDINMCNMLATWLKTAQHNDEDGRITHYLGMPSLTRNQVDTFEGKMRVGARLLLCTDGMQQAFFHSGW
ncbi:MAG: protein phosphatase 2C domain-containing protein, partial [Patescibacteria group bacterium]